VPDVQYHPAPSDVYRDPESLEETPLVPGMSPTENSLRWVRTASGATQCIPAAGSACAIDMVRTAGIVNGHQPSTVLQTRPCQWNRCMEPLPMEPLPPQGFINKVFGIVGCQLGLTAVMAVSAQASIVSSVNHVSLPTCLLVLLLMHDT